MRLAKLLTIRRINLQLCLGCGRFVTDSEATGCLDGAHIQFP